MLVMSLNFYVYLQVDVFDIETCKWHKVDTFKYCDKQTGNEGM